MIWNDDKYRDLKNPQVANAGLKSTWPMNICELYIQITLIPQFSWQLTLMVVYAAGLYK